MGFQEPCGLRPIRDEPKRCDSNEDRCYPFENEDPAPGGVPSHAIHVCNSVSQKSTRGARNDPRAEVDGEARLDLVALVVHGHQVDITREESRFENPHQHSTGNETAVRFGHALAHGHDAPEKYHSRDVK